MVAAAAAAWPQSKFAQGQVCVIHDDEQTRKGHPVERHDSANCLSAGVHICLRLTEQNRSALLLGSGQPRVKLLFVAPTGLPALGETLCYRKSDVVTGPGILRARIAQAHDETKLTQALIFSSPLISRLSFRGLSPHLFPRLCRLQSSRRPWLPELFRRLWPGLSLRPWPEPFLRPS